MDDAQAAKLRALAEKTDRDAYARGQHLGALIAPDELLALLDERDALRATIDRQMETCRIDTEQIGALQRERDAAMAKIAAHNAECESLCQRDTQGGRCEAYVSRGRECTDCPRNWMIDDSRTLLGDGEGA